MPKEVATPENPAVSPSGNYMLVVNSDNDGQVNFYSFQILGSDKGGLDRETLYVSTDRFTARHRTYFLWDQEERVWVYSGDVGTFFWERKPDNDTWEKHTYYYDGGNKVSAPEFLRKMRPQFFNK
jgi:hypothetical protein